MPDSLARLKEDGWSVHDNFVNVFQDTFPEMVKADTSPIKIVSQFSDEWKEWVLTNVKRGCSRETLQDILYENNFDKSETDKLLDEYYKPSEVKKRANAQWRAWVKENAERGCHKEELRAIMEENGLNKKFITDSIKKAYQV